MASLRTSSQERSAAPRSLPGAARAAAACAAAALAIAGCSAAGGTSPAAHGSHSSPAGTGGTSPSEALTLAAAQVGHVTSFSATMDVTSTGKITSHLTGTLDEQVTPAVAKQTLNGTANGTTVPGGIQTVLTANAVYLKMSTLRALTHKPWLQITFSSLRSSTGASLAPLVHELQSSDPLLVERMLTAATGVHRVGGGTVDGVATTEYSGTLNLATAMGKVAPGLRNLVQPIMSSLGISTDRFTVWLDGQHQVRRMVEEEIGKGYQSTLVMTVTSINTPLGLSAPPAGQVGTIAGL